ncbi:MAG: TRAM domain-containing protein [Candidatus Aenigmatarchaeota archaeon]
MPFRRGGFRRFGPRVDIPKPVKVGEEYDVEINEVGSKGDGIARIKNFVVFIAGAKQGEKTKIKITEVRNRFAIGEKVSGEAAEEATEEEAEEAEEELETEETGEEE